MSQIFLSHSNTDTAAAIVLRDWLAAEGWNDLFVDLEPVRAIAAAERWQQALKVAARRCEAVLFLLSRAWLGSPSCRSELNLARRLNKRLFGLLIEEGLAIGELPLDVTSTWQLVNLAPGRDRQRPPKAGEELAPTFSPEGLARLREGLQRAGSNARNFPWPPAHDPERAPYRGLRPLEASDAGIFFGRDGSLLEAAERMRALHETAAPRLLVLLGPSGAGKSSFLRAGLLPRLARDDPSFLCLPLIRPQRSPIGGKTGLLRSLEGAFQAAMLKPGRGELSAAIEAGGPGLKPLLGKLLAKGTPIAGDGNARPKPPALVLAIDQAEELFLAEAGGQAQSFLALVRDLIATDAPAVIAVFAIRSDDYERLQEANALDGVQQDIINLPPMPKCAFEEVIKGPARRLESTNRSLKIDDALLDQLRIDMEGVGGKDALPLLAFTLERLYREYGATGHLRAEHYHAVGGVKGSIEAAVEHAFIAADTDRNIPKDHKARLVLLRRSLIPWLAGIELDTGAPRRRVAKRSEIPTEARALIDHLIGQRLLVSDLADDAGETTIEPAHEALLRQWNLLLGWLKADTVFLSVLDGVKRASRDWAANSKSPSWLAHSEHRLRLALKLVARPDLAANLEPLDKQYISACKAAERAARRGRRAVKSTVGALALLLVAAGVGWWQEGWIWEQYHWRMVMGPKLLTSEQEKEKAAQPKGEFKECTNGCPTLVVVPAGKFVMGSPEGQGERSERPQHEITIPQPFAVGKTEVTFAEWDMCVAAGACPDTSDSTWGRGDRPVINVGWDDAKGYVAWLSRLTGKDYRLLTEAEWEYAARAGSPAHFTFGEEETQLGEYAWFRENSGGKTQPVGKKQANGFGLYDMHGNVWEWVEDCWNGSFNLKPLTLRSTGGAWKSGDCNRLVLRGGSWLDEAGYLRAAYRDGLSADFRLNFIGFRVARALTP